MSKLIRHTQKRGTALFVALSLTALTVLGLVSFVGGPQSRDGGTPAKTQVSAPVAGGAAVAGGGDAGIQSAQDQTQPAQPLTAADLTAAEKAALRQSAHFAKKLYEPLASQVFNLATSRAESAAAANNAEGPGSPNKPKKATLTTDREDYQPYTYVYFTGAGFQPGETVDMIVVETDPIQQSFQPWTVVADANGNFQTSWYVFSSDFLGATFQATATGESSHLTASATFTDASGDGDMQVNPSTAVPGSTGNSFTFNFRSPVVTFAASSYVDVVVPTGLGWTTPQISNSSGAGFVSTAPVGSGVTITSTTIPVAGTIRVTFTLTTAGAANGFDISYGVQGTGVTAPSTAGFSQFITGSHAGAGGSVTAINSSPHILVTSSTTDIFLRGGSSNKNTNGNATTLAIAKPIGVVSGDVMFANFQVKNGTGTQFPILAGWTNVTTPVNYEGGGANHRTALLYRVADSTDAAVTAYTFVLNGGGAVRGDIAAWANVAAAPLGPFDVAPCNYTSTTANAQITGVSCPGGTPNPGGTGITTVSPDAAVVLFASGFDANLITVLATATSPGALNEIYGDIADANTEVAAGWAIKTAAGATGTGSATVSNSKPWAAILIALKPNTCPSLTASSSVTTPIACNGGNAVVTVTASGGTAPYTGTGTFNHLAGNYTYTVTDNNGCTANTTGTITEPTAVTASSTVTTPIACNGGMAVVTVSASGGTSPYTGTGTFSHLAGNYTYTVTDAHGCPATTTGTITEPTAVTASSTVTTPIACNGGMAVVTVSASGGTSPYTGTGTFSHLAGNYTYTVTDAHGCPATTTGTITEPTAVTASSTVTTPIACNGGMAVVTVSASGGTSPYSGTGTFSHLAGNYTYTVTDAHGCPATTTGTITEPTAVTASSTVTTPIACNGGMAVVTVSASGGTSPYSGTGTFSHLAGNYTYTVTDGHGCPATTTGTITEPTAVTASSTVTTPIACNGGMAVVTVSASGGTSPYSGTGTFSHLAGNYTYTVTDNNGCPATTTGTITEPTAVTASSTVTTPIACNGGMAVVTVSASGGTSPYTGTGTFSHLAGNYTYTVTDNNGCPATTTGTITEPTAVTASSTVTTPIACNGGMAVVTVSASGGTSPYTGTGTFSHLAGNYTYTVADNNGCPATTTGTITEPTAVTATSTVTTPIACNGGMAVVTVSASGGTAPYTGTGTFNHLAGNYTYTVTDAHGCPATTTGTITEPTAVTASSTVTTPIACNGGMAVVTVSASGGTPCSGNCAPYSGTGTFSHAAGTYSYTVTDHNGCPATTTGTITEPTAVTASSTVTTPIACNGGMAVVTVSASGGTAPYSGTGAQSPQPAGPYSYTVTDANGCPATTTGTITEPTALTLSLSVTACSSGSNGAIQASFGGGTSPYQVKIDAGAYSTQTSPYTFTGLAPGSHMVTVRDANGCTTSDSITVPTCAMTGSISIRGGARLDTTNCNTAKKVMSWLNGASQPPTVVTASGSFATYVNVGDSVMMGGIWTFGSGLANLWSVDGFTFNLTTSTKTYNMNGFLVVTGPGTISGDGFDPTPGTWTFTTQNPPANGIFSFSASTSANSP